MLSRLLPKPSHFSLLTRISSKFHPCPQTQSTSPLQNPTFTTFLPRFFSTGGGDDDDDQSHSDVWKLSTETDEKFDPLFGENDVSESAPPRDADTWRRGGDDQSQSAMWNISKESDEKSEALFGSGDVPGVSEAAPPREADSWLSKGGGDEWDVAEGFKPWSLGGEEDKSNDLFQVGGGVQGDDGGASVSSVEDEAKRREEALRLEKEEKELREVLKGPNRAFGDLIAASGITDEMLDSLIALKDFQGIKGLPPLSEIEEIRYEKNTRQSSRAEMERQKQEEVAKARVRQVDDKERAYGTGRRKCSIARVWIQPGEGNFIINDKQFDVYFPMLDHRAAILRPFSETKTLGLWDIKCTVQGGGTTGQVGAIQLGISRALQNWEPDLRPTLKSSGFLTRDSRVVERKKPGKAKARKSFQWVKR